MEIFKNCPKPHEKLLNTNNSVKYKLKPLDTNTYPLGWQKFKKTNDDKR